MHQTNTTELVDFLKGYSIFSIVVFHILKVLDLTPLMKEVIFFGGTGVHTFILISGFGLFLSWNRKPLKYPEYLKKRFIKIYIPYIFIVSVIAFISLFIPIYHSTWYSYFGHVLLYKMFAEDIMGSFGDHFWFLSTIFQFYIIFPLLVKIKSHLNNYKFFMFGLIISMLWIFAVLALDKQGMRTWNSFFLQYLWEFILGIILAGLYMNKQKMPEIRLTYIVIIAITALAGYGLLALKMGNLGKMINDIPALIGYTFFAIFIYRLNFLPITRFFVFTGSFSFSLYLIHILTLKMALYILKIYNIDPGIISSGITLAISYALAYYFNQGTLKFYSMMKI
jgi:peptidoglycan/LPS O-acetylase OafA/YrhL